MWESVSIIKKSEGVKWVVVCSCSKSLASSPYGVTNNLTDLTALQKYDGF